ncbi:SIS domain-containing protein [Paeniglutamicibacter antarcticus]|uniref:SIS domain-containing protein n=1 Tax=Arthrobacter terrae TaxID=2935737 RepID=A0A931GBY8_9MICC|nr:SIS domain-containing protein [Arthrobacter terrae]MBG0741222.1 SIS domain-containing protein [Arthrobacter terrae]
MSPESVAAQQLLLNAGVPPRSLIPAGAAADASADTALATVLQHLDSVAPALESLRRQAQHLSRWGTELARQLMSGQRLLTAGNGGSAAEAQHLTAELVGRFDAEREPFSAIALHAETSAMTAIGNDYGYDQVFARQVRAHGRPGDVLILISTSGRSPNLLEAVKAAREVGVTSWALTGRGPNPLTRSSDDSVAVDALPANAQEGHLIALHALCRAFDSEVARARSIPLAISMAPQLFPSTMLAPEDARRTR